MKRLLFIVCLWLSVLPVAAQEEDVPISAGTDFYFTVFDHSPEHQQTIFLQIQACKLTRMTIQVGNKPVQYMNDEFGVCLGQVIKADPLEVVHVQTTAPCYVSAMVVGSTCGAETAILPTHLLGCSYMLQGMPGSLIELNGVPTQTYSQFSIVGTSDNTSMTIQSPVNLKCVTTNQTIAAGSKKRFLLDHGQVLSFQPVNYTQDITGVQVHSNQPVAVFQGNNLTRIYPGENWSDYTWEQARPITNWGTEFIVPKSALLQFNIPKVTALQDNTDVYCWVNGTKMYMTTLNAGESYARAFDTGTSGTLDVVHIQTTKPACCYLYFTGSTRNNGVGDPAMVEIVPMDRPSTDTRWVMTHPASNAPYKIRLLLTMRTDNIENVLINNYPASAYDLTSVTTEEYITYEMAYSAVQTMRIQALQGGFSAYTMHVGKTAEASAMNVALPEIPSPPELCTNGQLIYHRNSIGSYALFSETLDGFCAGSNLSFSALVSFIPYETVRLALIDPTSDTELTHYEWHFSEDESKTISYNGKKWYKVGLNYTVPEGQSDVTFRIENGYNAFIDSLEVRLCTPPLTIIAPDTVCVDTKNTFIADFENDGSLSEPLQYQWYFSADSITWTPINDGNERELKLKAKPKHTGWYKVAVAANGHIDNEYCRSVSEPFKFFVIEDCPPILCPEGVLILHEDLTGSETAYSGDLTGLCANLDLSLIVNLTPVHAAGRLLLRLTDIDTGRELRVYDTGDFPSDSMQVGTTFTVPEGVSNVRWTISNNIVGSIGSPLGIEDIEVRLCLEPIAVSGNNPACRKKPHVFRALYENYGILENPEYQWSYSADSVDWMVLQTGSSKTYTIPNVHKYHEGWYKVTVANAGNMEQVNCREESEPFKLMTQYCNTAVDQYVDTTACDTLLAYNLTWRGHEWQVVGTVTDTLIDIDEDDSVYVHKTLQTVICCPEIQYIRIDSITCDTLMPFLWFFRDTMLLYEDIGNNELEYQHYKWENCIGEVFTLALDTVHCERLYDLIVNKYNWQLLLDYTKLRRIFPERKYLAFQWYKNGEEIPGATGDDYAEQNELCGLFQLRIQLDEAVDNDDEYIWSKILEIGEVDEPQPVTKRIYNWHGMLVGEGQMTRGVYLIVNIEGDKIWTEKKVVW